jgi:hypothetical protein
MSRFWIWCLDFIFLTSDFSFLNSGVKRCSKMSKSVANIMHAYSYAVGYNWYLQSFYIPWVPPCCGLNYRLFWYVKQLPNRKKHQNDLIIYLWCDIDDNLIQLMTLTMHLIISITTYFKITIYIARAQTHTSYITIYVDCCIGPCSVVS